jgi:MFS family permease
VATLLLGAFQMRPRSVFLWAAVPAAIAMTILLVAVREQERRVPPPAPGAAALARRPPHLVGYLTVVGLFALGNSSDAFLLLRARDLGVAPALIPAIWMVHNASKALLATAGGALSDRVGRRGVIAAGFGVYALTYLGFGMASTAWQAWLLFIVYGLYYALVEGSERALVADLAGPAYRGRAFGYYHGVVGVVALPASVGFGLLAERYGARVPFTASAALAGVAAALLMLIVPGRGISSIANSP